MGGALSGFVVVSVPIGLGYVIARIGLLGDGAQEMLNRLVFYVLMPLLLFTLLAGAEISVVFSKLALVSFLSALAMFLAYWVIARFVWHRRAAAVTVGALAAGYTNANNIGLPIALHMLGNATLVAPIVLFQTVVFAPIALAILDSASSERRALWRVVAGALANPIVIGSATGLAVCLAPWDPPDLAMEAIRSVGQGGIPIMLLAFGMSLRGRTVLDPGPARREAILASALKLLAMPVAAFVLARYAFGLDTHAVYAAVTLATLPTAGNVYNYAARYGQSMILARDSISITIVGGAPVLFLVAWLLG